MILQAENPLNRSIIESPATPTTISDASKQKKATTSPRPSTTIPKTASQKRPPPTQKAASQNSSATTPATISPRRPSTPAQPEPPTTPLADLSSKQTLKATAGISTTTITSSTPGEIKSSKNAP